MAAVKEGDSLDLRIVLLGVSGAGKSSTGNAILGRDVFKESGTRESEKQRGRVEDRNISIIDTPGFFNTHLTDEEMKKQMMKSLDLSDPGPHVFLLVINLENFEEEQRDIVEEIQEIFGAQALKFTLVLFTGREQMSYRKWILKQRKIQDLVSQCTGKYHEIYNKSVNDSIRITMLLQKIDEIVKQNHEQHYESTATQHLTQANLRIVMVGKTGAGKSATGNTILRQKVFAEELSSESVTKRCQKHQQKVKGRIISVIDTPGVFDTLFSEEQMKKEIVKCVKMSVPGPHVFLLVIRLDVRFTEEKNTVKWIRENFGEKAARYTILLFTRGDQLKISIKEFLTKNKQINELVKQCNGGYHVFNNTDGENRSQVTELLEKIDRMVEENGGEHYTNEMYQEAQRKIEEEERRQREEEERRKREEEKIKEDESSRINNTALAGAFVVAGVGAALAGGALLAAAGGAVAIPAALITVGAAVVGGSSGKLIVDKVKDCKEQKRRETENT